MIPQVAMIQESVARAVPITPQAGGVFYGRGCEIAPEPKPLFRGDMTDRGRKLIATLASRGRRTLRRRERAGAAPCRFGIKPAHNAPVGAALLCMLERRLGPEWRPALAEAWSAACRTLSQFMIGAAYGRPQAAEWSR